ncbi:hypothetical protein [Pedobacter nyackensis]|uniref:hypothetical protein n=1 Tax=Pedobacter nyackensis TaxID=475255 RepID=UPI00292FD925|nr:hypothetical protein [Pedobacter nyackensis]
METRTTIQCQSQQKHFPFPINVPNAAPFLSLPFCRLPFKAGTFKVERGTLNQFTDFRITNKPYLNVEIRKVAFEHEFWTLAVTIAQKVEQVYIKVTPTELLVSCSTGANERHLSQYAYHTVCRLIERHKGSGFYDYYWPDLGSGALQKKFLKLLKSKTGLEVLSRDHLQGLFKPGQFLPKIEQDTIEIQNAWNIEQKKLNYIPEKIISYNLLATPFYHWETDNHYPFLMPYQGILDTDKTDVNSFSQHNFDSTEPTPTNNLTLEEKQLNEICSSMRTIAPIKTPYNELFHLSQAEIRQVNLANFKALLKLWKLAFPLLHHQRHTYNTYTVSMRPTRNKSTPCNFNNQQAELCILRKEHPHHYSLSLLISIQGKIHQLPNHFEPTFFVATAENPKEYYLLNSVTDCSVLAFFEETDYKLLILKLHYDMYFKLFEDQLRERYKFISRK